MTNISDEIDALAQHAEPQTELARTRLALAEARRMNAELVEALERAFFTFGRFGGNHVSDLEAQTVRSSEIREAWLDARTAIAKAKP